MKKEYSWYFLLLLLALYFIAIAFFPALHLILDGMLVLALLFAFFGISSHNFVLFFIGLGFLSIYLKDLFHFTYSTGPLFAGLVLIGVILHNLIRPRSSYTYKSKSTSHRHFEGEKNANYIDNETDLYLRTFFSENTTYVTSKQLTNVYINTKFGEQSIDFTQAQFMTDSPEIRLDVAFGQTNIRIPGNWRIVNKTSTPFAAISYSGSHDTSSDDLVSVALTGTVAFGEAVIQY
ncbi:LiaF domain-containing protein [Streptococcus devriesei]|uniref:LiaF domain-containing protein n=1 Tax=Streptococcus devriesei TaxID=231233 RepID=UPI000422D355|nr:LiaF domain-containing protein [Streptococcus devriesei]